ncbi:MAG: HAMP domain-containing protein [archaeon]
MVSLKYKILFLTIIPLAIILFTIGGLTIYNKNVTERQLLLERLNTYKFLLESGDLNFETSVNKVKLEALLDEKVEFSEILGPNYEVKYSSENSASPLITNQEKKDIDDAFQGIETTKNIEAREGRKAAFVIISPLIVNNRIVAVLHQGLSYEKSNQRLMEYASYIAIFILGGILVCFISISILLNNVILRNIYELKKTAIEIGKGNLNKRIKIESQDEIGELASVFNSMTLDLEKSQEHLKQYNKELEKKVEERTMNLDQKIQELEKFSKMAVGRELRMIELKRKIKELEEKLQKK